jgi:hypothetical protein
MNATRLNGELEKPLLKRATTLSSDDPEHVGTELPVGGLERDLLQLFKDCWI